MRRQKRGSAELFVFAIVAVVALGGMILLARGGISGMLAKPYVYATETIQKGTIDDPWEGVTTEIIISQHGDYLDCRWECLARKSNEPFNLTKRRTETLACLEECGLKYGQPPWGYAETYSGPRHKI